MNNAVEVFRVYFGQIMLTWRLMRDQNVALWMKAVGALPFLYLIFPIDVIPDFIPVLGQLDDLAILWLGMKLFEGLVPENIVATHRAALNRQRDPNAETVDAPGYRVVDDEKPKNKRG